MSLGSNNPFPSVLLVEQASAPATPAAGHQRIYAGTDGHRKAVDDGGLVRDLDEIGVIRTSDPASPVDDTFWVRRDNASPQVVALRIRIAGVTYTLADVTI